MNGQIIDSTTVTNPMARSLIILLRQFSNRHSFDMPDLEHQATYLVEEVFPYTKATEKDFLKSLEMIAKSACPLVSEAHPDKSGSYLINSALPTLVNLYESLPPRDVKKWISTGLKMVDDFNKAPKDKKTEDMKRAFGDALLDYFKLGKDGHFEYSRLRMKSRSNGFLLNTVLAVSLAANTVLSLDYLHTYQQKLLQNEEAGQVQEYQKLVKEHQALAEKYQRSVNRADQDISVMFEDGIEQNDITKVSRAINQYLAVQLGSDNILYNAQTLPSAITGKSVDSKKQTDFLTKNWTEILEYLNE